MLHVRYLSYLFLISAYMAKSVMMLRNSQKPNMASYFVMNTNDGYKYVTDVQQGDLKNVVNSHYVYYDNGMPNMFKYRAGGQNYQSKIVKAPLQEQSFNAPILDQDTTTKNAKKFVENALKLMDNQALQVSFASQISPQQNQIMAGRQKKRPYAFSYASQQSAHAEQADQQGNVLGKYSYYDDAGFHDLSYKAGNDIGFVILGGSLAQHENQAARGMNTPIAVLPAQNSNKAQDELEGSQFNAHTAQVEVNVAHLPGGSYSYKWKMPAQENSHKRRSMANKKSFQIY